MLAHVQKPSWRFWVTTTTAHTLLGAQNNCWRGSVGLESLEDSDLDLQPWAVVGLCCYFVLSTFQVQAGLRASQAQESPDAQPSQGGPAPWTLQGWGCTASLAVPRKAGTLHTQYTIGQGTQMTTLSATVLLLPWTSLLATCPIGNPSNYCFSRRRPWEASSKPTTVRRSGSQTWPADWRQHLEGSGTDTLPAIALHPHLQSPGPSRALAVFPALWEGCEGARHFRHKVHHTRLIF